MLGVRDRLHGRLHAPGGGLDRGGIPGNREAHPGRRLPQVLYMVMVKCNLCGHSLFFDSENFISGDEPAFTNLTEAEEAAAEGS